MKIQSGKLGNWKTGKLAVFHVFSETFLKRIRIKARCPAKLNSSHSYSLD